ncbi:MAG: 50S ribosomal protein L3, partial [Candidatus Cloacimonadota bacterium]|nr:50S ribosomal protein L3 [Candidatus Cloacimonadota bacterium]
GYAAVQLGFESLKESKANKAQKGHFKKHKTEMFKYLKEFKINKEDEIIEGEKIDVSIFQEHELIKVTGTSKGRGFAGVMKRHGFHGFMSSHGVHESFRGPGSIGMCATPARVHKGKKMPGHFGNAKVSVLNLQVIKVDVENNLLLVKGAIPGHRNSLVVLKKEL